MSESFKRKTMSSIDSKRASRTIKMNSIMRLRRK